MIETTVVFTTLRLAAVTTVCTVLPAVPCAFWLAHRTGWFRGVVTTACMLPVVLPPSVLGFYLLILMGPSGMIGRITTTLGIGPLAFTFPGLVVAMVVYSFPYVLSPIIDAFEGTGDRPVEVAATLGAGPLDRFFTVIIPLAWRGIATAAALGFAHTIGAFGIALMVGGSIPGRTRLMSTVIFEHVETLRYTEAHALSLVLVLISSAVLLLIHGIRKGVRVRGTVT